MRPEPVVADDAAAIPGTVVREAIRWYVRLNDAADAGLAQACTQWRAAHPLNELAWCRLQHIDAGMSADLAATSDSRLAVAVLDDAARRQRRKALKLLSLGLLAGPSALMVREIAPWQQWVSDHATASGERRDLQLADGNLLQLDTASAVDVRFDDRRRLIALLRGTIRVCSEARFGAPPLVVRTRRALLETTAARFVVRDEADACRLDVQSGRVAIQCDGEPTPVVVASGEARRIDASGVLPAASNGIEAGAWADGVIVANDARLADFIAEVARYRRGYLGHGPDVGGLRLSGVFQLEDTDKLLAILARTLPVRVEYRSRWWVRVAARA